MLEDTLVVWTTEFGRTPFVEREENKGREHHAVVFCSWLAGAGVKPGITYGQSDDYGIRVAENEVHVHDLHATILNSLGSITRNSLSRLRWPGFPANRCPWQSRQWDTLVSNHCF
jgi:uncharacterized protein (DUF1501 family)